MGSNVSRVDHEHHVSPWNVPNVLTVFRLVLVPVFIWLMFLEASGARWWAVLVFMVAAATDQLDGHIARAQNLITDFGRLMDPIADKALTLGAFIMLSIAGLLPWWVTILIAIRELGITALRAVLLRRDIVVSANKGGKLKTVLQIFAIWLLLIPWQSLGASWPVYASLAHGMLIFGWVVAGLALLMTVWSGLVYVVEGAKLWKASSPKGESK
ncbi:CDP-diacylglycerol--glycerol-3-phosphate 3-phosphatidyltransferase [Schaalia turicensis]|uniref:CDP-diacylglycerol--glycerol-3-phosphate 3-phosphatidyltransferase n=1 Tax=Schaalia turicensis TaxID=131111 RepID=UPI001897C85E|nr:CDP-diacylglycerol--glycerol-3-phosphate 3-phosphatidyltransferase [Schaalia turicensis]